MNKETKPISFTMSFPHESIYGLSEEEKAAQAKIISHKAIEEIKFKLLMSAIDSLDDF